MSSETRLAWAQIVLTAAASAISSLVVVVLAFADVRETARTALSTAVRAESEAGKVKSMLDGIDGVVARLASIQETLRNIDRRQADMATKVETLQLGGR